MKKEITSTLNNTPCLCGNTSYFLLYEGLYNRLGLSNYSFSLYQCKHCSLVRVTPIPSISLYTDGYGASTSKNKEYIPRDKPWCLDLANEVEKLLSIYPKLKEKPVLDIGCNGGELVNQLKAKNIQAEGCDVDPVAIKYGCKQNLPLFLYDFSRQSLEPKYGLIIMNHTLEHIVPAKDALKNICHALLPGGILQIHVPNYGGWIPRIMKEKWAFLVPHQHVWHFTPETLKFHVESSLPQKIETIEIRCNTNLEPKGIGVKSRIKGAIISLTISFNKGDEIIATFMKMVD